MTFLEKLRTIESKNSSLSSNEIQERTESMQNFQYISAFEGMIPNSNDSKLYSLYANGKLSKQEYIDLCLEQIGYK